MIWKEYELYREDLYMSVGVMKDYKLRDLQVSHTLGDTEFSWADPLTDVRQHPPSHYRAYVGRGLKN